jgi:hypothetical protein
MRPALKRKPKLKPVGPQTLARDYDSDNACGIDTVFKESP